MEGHEWEEVLLAVDLAAEAVLALAQAAEVAVRVADADERIFQPFFPFRTQKGGRIKPDAENNDNVVL